MRVSARFSLLALLMAFGFPFFLQGGQEEEKEEPAQESKWDVNDPPGPRREVPIDVTEGTWMSLDVSPDGKEIAFDLLGNLYLLPIEGGEARELTRGIAWDMQPRFSPDGTRIAFTSDRGGGDNIWLVDRDGSNPRQVTKESFRLLNSPAWAPDGDFIAARKHFTSRRSLGAGEIWLYHASGGEGLKMTKRPNDQKDVGEPVFSPDGRYIYFSQDVTPGNVFEYNKDPNTQIYAIRRLDRETGKLQNYITGPGGAVRPTPSPDGSRIAFVRRVRYQTAVFIHDVDSGAEWPIYRGLDRDLQETWAIHGVYPSMSWTPDSRDLIFWSEGKIKRIQVETGDVREIPFRVQSAREVFDAVRFPVEVAPESFDVRMLRWVQVAPDQDRVVFQALGHLYARDLPEGEPRRLTVQNDHFEHYPAISRDGRKVAYVAWNDRDLGSVRVLDLETGESQQVTSEPGHYVEPAFSPDGNRIYYRKTSGSQLTSPLWAKETGIYRVPAQGGESTKLTDEGIRPFFGSDPDRLFLMRIDSDGNRKLVSVDAESGDDERTLYGSENATEFKVSPDGKWLAFTERFNAFITPFVQTGSEIPLGPKTRTVPVRQVSRDAGEYLHWSGDSQKLFWSLGSQLFERDLTEAFSFLPDAPDELPDPPAEGKEIGFQAESDVPEGRVALVGARIITMLGDEVIENGTVLVHGNRIEAVGPVSEVEVPADAHRVSVEGATIIPGLIDAHAHGPQGVNEIVPQQNWGQYSLLSFGVTTTHDPSNNTSTIFAAAEMARSGMITAPRIFSTGTILYGAAGSFKAEIDSLEDARSHLRRMKAAGAFSVKSYNQPRRDQRQQVIAAARELEMMVFPEGGSLFQHNMTMVVDGHTGIEHAIPVARMYDDALDLWASSKTGYTPTLVVAYGGLWGENYWYQKSDVWEHERLMTFVPREVVDPRARRRVKVPEDEFNHISTARGASQLVDRGVTVQIGAHGQREGLAPHWELWMFVQGGMTPLEALRSATLHGAVYLGMDADLGSLEPGKLADLAVLDGNPLEDIQNSEKVSYTMINGRLFEAATMNEIGNHPRARSPFHFEKEKSGLADIQTGEMR
ncbi:MAG TPA: amidohydrolase family protein [Acidobacteriota bacterium]|nr:amidohydrolase family protein [Acidobacteriota bacterium]